METSKNDYDSDHLVVKNFDDFTGESEETDIRIHQQNLPNTLLALICGPSGTGKSNALMALLLEKEGLKFKNIYIFANTLQQAKYKFLQKIITGVPGMQFFTFNNEKPLTPAECLPHSVVIFDDIGLESQKSAKSFFMHGRHFKLSVFFLSQSYSSITKQNLRDNSNFIILFKTDLASLKRIFDEQCVGDCTFQQFSKMCSDIWREKFQFLVIDKTCLPEKGKYRNGFNKFLHFK